MPWHPARPIGQRRNPGKPLVEDKPNPFYNPHEPTYRKFLFRIGLLLLVAAFAGYLAVPVFTSTQDDDSFYSYLPIVLSVVASVFVVVGIVLIVVSKLNVCWSTSNLEGDATAGPPGNSTTDEPSRDHTTEFVSIDIDDEDDIFVDCNAGNDPQQQLPRNIPHLTIRRPTDATVEYTDTVGGPPSIVIDGPDIDPSPLDQQIHQPQPPVPADPPIPVFKRFDLPYPSAKINYGKTDATKKLRPKSSSPANRLNRSHSSAADLRRQNLNFTGSGSPRSRSRDYRSTDIGRSSSSAADYKNRKHSPKNYRQKSPSTGSSENDDPMFRRRTKSHATNKNYIVQQHFSPIVSDPNRARRVVRSSSPTKKFSDTSAGTTFSRNSECHDEGDDVFSESTTWHNPSRPGEEYLGLQEPIRKQSAAPMLEYTEKTS